MTEANPSDVPTPRPGGAARVLLGVLALVAVVFVALKLVDQWPQLVQTWRRADGPTFALGVAAFLGAELLFVAAWPFTMRRMGHPVDTLHGGALFAVTQTAKFVPGSVWHALGRVEAAHRVGVPRRATAASVLLESGAMLFAAAVVGAVTGVPGAVLGVHGIAAVGLSIAAIGTGAAAFVVGRRLAGRVTPLPSDRELAPVVALQVVVWAAYGVAAAVIGRSLGVLDAATVAGGFALSWAAGFVVVAAPAGLGVREWAMTTALSSSTSQASALAVAVGTRVVWTAVQLVAAVVGAAILGARRRELLGADSAATAPAVHGAASGSIPEGGAS